MVRKGIYVNGKEIVARYVGDKLVWRKNTEKLWLSTTVSWRWSTPPANRLALQTTETSTSSTHTDVEVPISRVSVGDRSWEATRFGFFYTQLYGDVYYQHIRITFKNLYDKTQFHQFMTGHGSQVTINLYRKE